MHPGDIQGVDYMTTSLLDSFPMPKNPRPPRMQRVPENKNIGSWNKQPRPLQDGNWVCEDQYCNNVNYPRRTQCHQCGKKRGPIGDAVVNAYLGMQPFESAGMANPVHPGNMSMILGMFPVPHNGLQAHPQRMAFTDLNCTRDFDPWRGEPFEKQAHIGLQYLPPGSNFLGRGAFISIATEGKRLAEHLVTLFAASSSDPLGDSGECLASAALWLQKMKCSLKDYQNSNAGMHTSPFMSRGFTTFRGIPLSAEVTKGTESMVSQNHGNSTPMMAPQSALNIGDYSKEFTHTKVETTSDIHRNLRPDQQEENCSWECEDCKIVNLPERETCIQCNHRRLDRDGEEIVTKCVDILLADSEDDVQH